MFYQIVEMKIVPFRANSNVTLFELFHALEFHVNATVNANETSNGYCYSWFSIDTVVYLLFSVSLALKRLEWVTAIFL